MRVGEAPSFRRQPVEVGCPDVGRAVATEVTVSQVIGVDQDSDEQSDMPEVARTVTVEVSPEQGQRLALAQEAGTLSLTLRTLEASEDAPLDSIRLSDLLIERSPVPVTEPVKTIKVRRANVMFKEEIR